MKKVLLIILLILSLTSCKDTKTKEIEIPEINDKIVESYIDTNPIKIGIYDTNKLIKEFKTWTTNNLQDIGVFNIYFTDKEYLDSTWIKYNFNKYYNEYKDISNYKIGFYVSFEADDKKIEKNILGPKDTFVLTPYIYNYLYDDVHQADGAWYSHIEEKDMKDNTVFSSIKLFSADIGSKIKYPITLKVFTYDSEDDFDESGFYRGNSSYTITIIK